jgi:hypothetical protein
MKTSEIEEDWADFLERIYWPLPLRENLIARYPTAEPFDDKDREIQPMQNAA